MTPHASYTVSMLSWKPCSSASPGESVEGGNGPSNYFGQLLPRRQSEAVRTSTGSNYCLQTRHGDPITSILRTNYYKCHALHFGSARARGSPGLPQGGAGRGGEVSYLQGLDVLVGQEGLGQPRPGARVMRGVEGASQFFLWVSCLLARFTGISPECHRNVELEHLNKGDNHNSAFPQWEVLRAAPAPWRILSWNTIRD